MTAIKRALISVSDKTGINDFARDLRKLGVEILSTGGTAKLLADNDVDVIEVSDYTGFPEMMDGRVKTLHPKIHGGLLGRRGIDDQVMAGFSTDKTRALLAFLAGGAVRIDRSALTALLLHDHPLNVRGLLAVVERARRRHELAGASGTSGERDPIHILKDDLDDELIDIADDLFRESVGHTAEQNLLEFRVDCPDPRMGHVFQQAAEILSSYRLTTAKAGFAITDRPREARFDSLWESADPARNAAKAPTKVNPAEEFVDRWLDLVGDMERSLGQQPDALQQTLDTAARLFAIRWAKTSEQTYVKGLLGQKNQQRRGRKNATFVQTRHLAASLGTNSSAIDNLIAKRKA